MTDFVQAPEQDVVISSRVRLARNYQDLPFSPKLTREAAEQVISRAHEAMKNSPEGGAFTPVSYTHLPAPPLAKYALSVYQKARKSATVSFCQRP